MENYSQKILLKQDQKNFSNFWKIIFCSITLLILLFYPLLPSKASNLIDSDGDGLFDLAEIKIWNTNPHRKDSDEDGFSDFLEVISGYDPLCDKALKIDTKEHIKKMKTMEKMQNEETNKEQIITEFTTKEFNENDYNFFETESGIFRFYYQNNFAVKKFDEIYYLQDLKNKQIAFQIFENREDLNFSKKEFACRSYDGNDARFENKKVCFTRDNNDKIIINLELFTKGGKDFQKKIDFFMQKGLIKQRQILNQFSFFTRSEAIKFILRLRFPQKDFESFRENCFIDVIANYPSAGEICYAKKMGIINGIQGRFYPYQSVNLWGVLKMLFLTFEVESRSFQEKYLDDNLFIQMQKIHAGYPIIAKSLYEGIFENPTDETLWSNRHIYFKEAIEIIYNFLHWREGKKIRNYDKENKNFSNNFIFLNDKNIEVNIEEKNKFKMEYPLLETKLLQRGSSIDIFIKRKGNVFEYLYTLEKVSPQEIQEINVSYSPVRMDGRIQIIKKNGNQEILKLSVKNRQFEFLKNRFFITKSRTSKLQIEQMGLLPNDIPVVSNETIPTIKIYLAEKDLFNIFAKRTSNRRYRAFLEMIYPDGSMQSRSIVMKTRGNASRGYIKSSYTIESFDDFEENAYFPGDEFLAESDEFKMRSFIGEETMIHEKLFYQAFNDLGYSAPNFFGALLQINGVNMGFYQVTEPIKKDFFRYRSINTENYFYARNSGSIYDTNLKFYENDQLTLSQYKIRGKEDHLLMLIRNLEANNKNFMSKINIENVFDYAAFVFLTNASDSLTHNFYVYFDDDMKMWNIFPWDADTSFEYMPPFEKERLIEFGRKNNGSFNNLIYYVFRNLNDSEIDFYFKSFRQKWKDKVDIKALIEKYEKEYKKFFLYDNRLWNGKFLERKKVYFNTNQAIKELKEDLKSLNDI